MLLKQSRKSEKIWEPIDPPHILVWKWIYKRLVRLRAAFILLISAWHMKPAHFRPNTDSVYRNLGWGIPLIPGLAYALGAHPLISHMVTHDLPSSLPDREWLSWVLFIGNVILIGFLVYSTAFLGFCFHIALCFIGTIFDMHENPPPYQFFLVRTSGAYTWFGVLVCLLVVPGLAALQPDSVLGNIASYLVASPVIFLAIFLFAGISWQRASGTDAVGLKQMYQSDEFITFFRRVQFGIALMFIVALVVLGRNPEFVLHLLGK